MSYPLRISSLRTERWAMYGLAVGASYGNGGRADFSNYGANLSLLAPGAAAAVPRERWRVYLTDDDPPEAVPFCPDCAAEEFG